MRYKRTWVVRTTTVDGGGLVAVSTLYETSAPTTYAR